MHRSRRFHILDPVFIPDLARCGQWRIHNVNPMCGFRLLQQYLILHVFREGPPGSEITAGNAVLHNSMHRHRDCGIGRACSWEGFGVSGDPPDPQGQPPPLPFKILFYYGGKNTPTRKRLRQNKVVDLKSASMYRWNRQNRAFARRFPASPLFSDITCPTTFLPDDHFAVCCPAAFYR